MSGSGRGIWKWGRAKDSGRLPQPLEPFDVDISPATLLKFSRIYGLTIDGLCSIKRLPFGFEVHQILKEILLHEKLFAEFKDFVARGNVMDMAIGVIIGGAFMAIVNSLVNIINLSLNS